MAEGVELFSLHVFGWKFSTCQLQKYSSARISVDVSRMFVTTTAMVILVTKRG